MLTQMEQVDASEIWADLQYHKVLNYLTGNRVYTHGSVRLVWLGAPWLALYSGLEYEQGGGPLWVLHTESLTGHLYETRKTPTREVFLKFAALWLEYAEAEDLKSLPVSVEGEAGRQELRKWAGILDSMARDPVLWPSR